MFGVSLSSDHRFVRASFALRNFCMASCSLPRCLGTTLYNTHSLVHYTSTTSTSYITSHLIFSPTFTCNVAPRSHHHLSQSSNAQTRHHSISLRSRDSPHPTFFPVFRNRRRIDGSRNAGFHVRCGPVTCVLHDAPSRKKILHARAKVMERLSSSFSGMVLPVLQGLLVISGPRKYTKWYRMI